ncbi:MAG: carboxypeptidase regulatory-like domain-containing protein [bacterium]|nr:carboxypeptidase regulatory-like domain-containing protein [bacterium]
MSRHSSAGNSGSSSWIFAILALAVLGSVLWIVRPSNGALEDAIPETAAPESPPPSEPPAPASLQEIDPGEAEARQPVEADGATPIAQDEEHPLRGRVVPNHYLPSDEVLEVSVEVWVPSSDEGSETDPNEWVRWFPGARKWREVTRLTPDASGRFSTPRPLDVSMVRLRVDGQYITGGEFEYKVGSEEEPGDGEFEMPACVGAHVTLRLDLDDIATQDEIAALEGDVLALSSTGSSSQNGFFSGSPFEREQKLNREGKAVFQGLSTYDWSEGHSMPTSEHQNLAPFRIKPGFHFEPSPGERVVIDVPMMRGLELQGVVLDGADQPIEGAEVVADLAWQAGSLSGTSRERRTTDAAGQFLFQALSDTPFGLEINAPGFLDFKIGSSDITPLIGTKEPNTFHLKRGRVLKVRVTDARGLPAHGLPIQLHKGTSKEALFNLRTDEHGLVEFIGLPSGPLSLSAKGRLRNELQKDPEERLRFLDCQHNPFGALPRTDLNVEALWYAQASVPVDQLESGETLELEVRIAPMVRGTVTGVDPAWTDPVRLAILQPDPNMPTFARRSMMGVRGEGTFAVDPDTGAFEGQLLPGHYTAIAYSGRRTNGLPTPTSTTMRSSPEIEFDVGTVDLNLNIPFARTRFIEGSVHLTDGTGLAELTVRLSKKEDWFTSAIGAATTNATGHFRFEADGPGTYHLRIDSPRYLLAQATQLEIKPGTTPPTQRLTAVQAGALRVNMVAVDGSPLVTTSVQVFKANGANTYARPIQHDPDWAGTFGPLAPGSYTVMVPQNLTEASTILHRKAFAIKPSEITEVTLHALDEPTATVSGTVTMSGKPIEDIAVWCSNDMGVIALNETDAEGHYTLALTEVGPMSLQYGPNRWTQIEQQAIDVAPGLNSMLPLSVPSGAIEGQFEGQPMMVFPALFRADAAEDEEAFRQCGSIMNGRFTISYLPDGLYNLTAIDREGKPSADYTPQTVEIKGGSVVRDLEVIPRE